MDLAKIELSETSIKYWKEDSMYWWKRYLRNVAMVRRLRAQNRILRQLLSDYVS